MSSPPKRPFNPLQAGSSKDRDAPAEGRLANVASNAPSGELTKAGNTRMRFTPKPIGRKSEHKYYLLSKSKLTQFICTQPFNRYKYHGFGSLLFGFLF
jgi:hypothetical protein